MDVAQKRKVNWWLVIAGLLTGWITGAVAGFFAAAGGTIFFPGNAPAAGAAVTVAVALLYIVAYLLVRRPAPDFAAGMVIAGGMMALISGACGAFMSALTHT